MKNIARIFIAGVLVVLFCALSGCGGSKTIDIPGQTNVPLENKWIGRWRGIDEFNREQFFVDIAQNAVQIMWEHDEGVPTNDLFWAGTFEQKDDYVISNADKKAMDHAPIAERTNSKTFVQENGTLTFEATFMGFTKTIRLEK